MLYVGHWMRLVIFLSLFSLIFFSYYSLIASLDSPVLCAELLKWESEKKERVNELINIFRAIKRGGNFSAGHQLAMRTFNDLHCPFALINNLCSSVRELASCWAECPLEWSICSHCRRARPMMMLMRYEGRCGGEKKSKNCTTKSANDSTWKRKIHENYTESTEMMMMMSSLVERVRVALEIVDDNVSQTTNQLATTPWRWWE